MPLLMELENVLGCDFYKDFAPDGAGCHAPGAPGRSSSRGDFFLIKILTGAKAKAPSARHICSCSFVEIKSSVRSGMVAVRKDRN